MVWRAAAKDACIYIIKQQPPSILDRLVALPSEDVGISVITASELRFGASKSARAKENHAALDNAENDLVVKIVGDWRF